MTAQVLIDAFRLPAQALVAQRIPKKLLVEQGAPTAADKRLINDTIDELWWQATLKPATVGVPAFHSALVPSMPTTAPTAGAGSATGGASDGGAASANATEATDVIELALVSAHLRPPTREAQARRLMQLIHRAIPYPVLLVTQAPTGTVLSVAHKRASLGEAGKWVVADGADTHAFDPAQPTAAETEFMASLALEQLPPSALADLRALYQAVADRITALAVAQVTGHFKAPDAAAAAPATASGLRRELSARLPPATRRCRGPSRTPARVPRPRPLTGCRRCGTAAGSPA